MTTPDYDLLVSWVVNDVRDKFDEALASVIRTRLEHWFTETREALMRRAAEIARAHRCLRHGCECQEEIGRDLDEARISG